MRNGEYIFTHTHTHILIEIKSVLFRLMYKLKVLNPGFLERA